MSIKRHKTEPPRDLLVFLAEVGEAVKEYLETKHRERRTIRELTKDGEEENESSRVLPGQ